MIDPNYPLKPVEAQNIIGQDLAEYPNTSWGVTILRLDERVFGFHDDTPFPAASINKLAIAHAVNESGLPADTELTLTEEDKAVGNGVLRHFPLGHQLSLGQTVELALGISDNTAAKMLVRTLGGPAETNERLEDSALVLRHTRLTELEEGNPDPTAPFEYGTTTAVESAELMRILTENRLCARALSRGNFMGGIRHHLEIARRQQVPSPTLLKVARLFGGHGPKALYTALQNQRAPHTEFPNKEGSYDNLRHDVGCIGRYVVAALSESDPDEAPVKDMHHTRKVQAQLGDLLSMLP